MNGVVCFVSPGQARSGPAVHFHLSPHIAQDIILVRLTLLPHRPIPLGEPIPVQRQLMASRLIRAVLMSEMEHWRVEIPHDMDMRRLMGRIQDMIDRTRLRLIRSIERPDPIGNAVSKFSAALNWLSSTYFGGVISLRIFYHGSSV